MKIVSLITTCLRREAFFRTLPQVVALGAPVVVVDDGGLPTPLGDLGNYGDVDVITLPKRRGLAGAWNVGLSYIMADPDVTHINYIQDDCEIDPMLLRIAEEVMKHYPAVLFTGNHAKEHAIIGKTVIGGVTMCRKSSCRATHMFASVASWRKVMPIRSRGLGLPGGLPDGMTAEQAQKQGIRGRGSDTDWWITRDAPHKLSVMCVPGLVRIFLWEAKDSMWANRQVAGPDDPMTREYIKGWPGLSS